jgi:hypothetical protein
LFTKGRETADTDIVISLPEDIPVSSNSNKISSGGRGTISSSLNSKAPDNS